MPSLTVFTEEVTAVTLEFGSADLVSSQVAGCAAEELLSEERDELRPDRSELMVL